MTIEIPDEVLKSDLSLTAKLIVATAMTYPHTHKSDLAKMLGANRNTFFKALKTAKDRGVYNGTASGYNGTVSAESGCGYNGTGSGYNGTGSIKPSPPDLVGQLVVGEKETKTLKATTPPTKEEVAKYGAELGAAGSLIAEFFTTYEERGWMANGEPIRSWKKMLGWWVRNKKPAPTQTKTKPSISAEEARYLMDAAS